MNTNSAQAGAGFSIENVLRDELAQGDAMLGTIAPILRHLLNNSEHSVFSDEIVARVRGMLSGLVGQLLDAKAEAAGHADQREHPADIVQTLQDNLAAHQGLLAHVHALAMEWQLTERLHARLALDPVISPLLQALIASPDSGVATRAMALLAAQARFAQAQRRMELALTELPGDLLHGAFLTLRAMADGSADDQHHTEEAERAIRARFDESRSRLGLIASLLVGMGGGASAALSITHGGVAIFVSALGMASAQGRDLAILSTNDAQLARLALAMRAAGIKPETVEEEFASLHPAVALPDNFAQLGPDRAAAILAQSAVIAGG